MVVIDQGSTGPASVINCYCVISASSVRGSGGTIQKAVIELGGLDGTASSTDGIHVDGFYVEYSVFLPLAHNYTTILLHGNPSTRYINSYRNVNFDTKSIPSQGAPDTLGGRYANTVSPWVDPVTSVFPYYVEIGGGHNKNTCVVENLRVVNVQSPAVTHVRGLIYAVNVTGKGMVVDGDGTVPVGGYGLALVTLVNSKVHDLVMMKRLDIKMSGVGLWYLGLDNARVVGGGFYAADPPSTLLAWIVLGAYSMISDFVVRLDGITLAGPKRVIAYLLGNASRIADSDLTVMGDVYGIPLISTIGSDCKVSDNRLMVSDRTAFAQIALGGNNTVSLNNLCVAIAGGIPAATSVAIPATSVAIDYQQTTTVAELPD
jgi:hypothetical protein